MPNTLAVPVNAGGYNSLIVTNYQPDYVTIWVFPVTPAETTLLD